jgi:hypothetical protein
MARLAEFELPDGARAIDFGIRGLDLAYALVERHEAVILVDAASRGEQHGTLYVLELTGWSSPVGPPLGLLVVAAAVLGLGFLAWTYLGPDLRRYMKIHSM